MTGIELAFLFGAAGGALVVIPMQLYFRSRYKLGRRVEAWTSEHGALQGRIVRYARDPLRGTRLVLQADDHSWEVQVPTKSVVNFLPPAPQPTAASPRVQVESPAESTVSYEVQGRVFGVPRAQATLLAENLRLFSSGKFPEDEAYVAKLGANPAWREGARAVADWTEAALVGERLGPLPLEGKAGEATYWALRLMTDTEPDSGGAAGLRRALETSRTTGLA